MAALPTNVVPLQGLQLDELLVAATSGGDNAATGAGVFLVVKNGDASSHTVTLPPFPAAVDGDLTVPSRAVAVPAGKTKYIPLTDRYRNPSTGKAAWTYDAVTTVTVAVIRVSVS